MKLAIAAHAVVFEGLVFFHPFPVLYSYCASIRSRPATTVSLRTDAQTLAPPPSQDPPYIQPQLLVEHQLKAMLAHLARRVACQVRHPAAVVRLRAAAARAYTTSRRPAPAIVCAVSVPFKAVPLFQPVRVEPGEAALGLWQSYLRSLEARPLLTKSLTSFGMTYLSDTVAQLLGGAAGAFGWGKFGYAAALCVHSKQSFVLPVSIAVGWCSSHSMAPRCTTAGYSIWRCVRLALYAASVGAVTGHYWHRWLDATCCPERPQSWRAVGGKLALDQLLFAPVMTGVWLAFIKAAEGAPHLAAPFVAEKLLGTLLASYTGERHGRWAILSVGHGNVSNSEEAAAAANCRHLQRRSAPRLTLAPCAAPSAPAVWPAVNIITFKVIPQDLRILFCSAVGLFWVSQGY